LLSNIRLGLKVFEVTDMSLFILSVDDEEKEIRNLFNSKISPPDEASSIPGKRKAPNRCHFFKTGLFVADDFNKIT
jgi:hypothetical protein